MSCQPSPAASRSPAWLPDQARSAWTASLGEAEGAAGPLGLGLAVRADRPPHGHVRRHRRAGGRVAVQVDVRPAQRPGLLGADPGQQAQHDVGVHEFGRAADVLQAGPQFQHRQGPGRGDDRHGLVQGQRLGRPAVLALGGVGQGGDVAADQVVGFGVPDGALERQVPHGHRRGGVPGGHRGQRLPDVGGGQVAELAGADDFQDRLQDVLVLRDRLGRAAVQPVGEPVLGGLPDGVVGVAGLGGDALVELGVQVAELVDDGGLGLAADLAAGALAVAGVAEGDLAAPQARGSAGGGRGSRQGPRCSKEMPSSPRLRRVAMAAGYPVVGTISGDNGQHSPRHFQTLQDQN